MFDYICQECGKGTVRSKTFHNYHTKIRGYPFVVNKAIIGVCDKCGAKHFDANETERWEEIYHKELESENLFLQPENIKAIRKSLSLSMEDFAYLIGCTRQSLYNWEKKNRAKPQSRMADLMMRLIKHSSENGEVDVIRFLVEEAGKMGIAIEIIQNNGINGKDILLTTKKET